MFLVVLKYLELLVIATWFLAFFCLERALPLLLATCPNFENENQKKNNCGRRLNKGGKATVANQFLEQTKVGLG